jgi:hypothetical protein
MTEKPAISGWNSSTVLFEEGPQEPHAQRVFAIHLLGIIGPRGHEENSHQQAPFNAPFDRKRVPLDRKSSMAGRSS